MKGGVERNKIWVFRDPIPQFTEAQLAVYVAAGYELGLVKSGGSGVEMSYVKRGDTTNWDADVNASCDGSDHEADLSVIVPAGAKVVQLRTHAEGTSAGLIFLMGVKGESGWLNAIAAETVAATGQNANGLLAVGADGKVAYNGAVGITMATYVVMGWFI